MAHIKQLKKAVTAATTFGFALAIGFVMQYGDADASRFAGDASPLQRTVLPAQLDSSPLKPATTLEAKVPAPIQMADNPFDMIRTDPNTIKLSALVAEAAQASFAQNDIAGAADKTTAASCEIDVASAVGEQATLILSVQSFCRPDMWFDVHHNGMIFSAITDAFGQAAVIVPALTTNASLFVTFEDGTGSALSAVVPEADAYNRVVLQWDGIDADLVQKTAVETGLTTHIERFGTAGGEKQQFAEVVTFPASLPIGDVLQGLTVQAPIETDTCGQQIAAQTFHVSANAEPEFKDIQITLPDCDHIGTYLELKKVLGGQTLLPR